MPFPVEKFCGTWKAERESHSDNFSRFWEGLGIPAEMVQKMREATFRLNASLSGDKFTFMYEIWGKQHEATFILGVEGEEGDPLVGGKRRVTYVIEGDYLVAMYPDYNGSGTAMRLSSQFIDDDTIRTVMTDGDHECCGFFKRC
ncbi:uncharacterized protein [Branchiostoma lanceolatum]|uniref:uncharacterized protein n=1 Tax=Branchiostoma lanceolatum TaxID=7740 RepID=UPI0034572EAD